MSLDFAHYGDDRPVDATDEEQQIFEELQGLTAFKALPAPLELVRRSSSYVTAAVGEWDLARFKYTDRAKWLMYPLAEHSVKHKLGSIDDLHDYDDLLDVSVDRIKKHWND